jgi:hypothetical protein
MSQLLQSPAKLHKKAFRDQNRNLTLTVVSAMVVVAAVLSVLTTALPDWVFHPSDLPSFPLP